jgi:hypothetical protein
MGPTGLHPPLLLFVMKQGDNYKHGSEDDLGRHSHVSAGNKKPKVMREID